MREITADVANRKITETAQHLISEIQEFNHKHPGTEPIYSSDRLFTTLTSCLSILLANKYVIVPPKESPSDQYSTP